jgi:hypothetical protein
MINETCPAMSSVFFYWKKKLQDERYSDSLAGIVTRPQVGEVRNSGSILNREASLQSI